MKVCHTPGAGLTPRGTGLGMMGFAALYPSYIDPARRGAGG